MLKRDPTESAARRIISRLGGISALSKGLKHRNPSTVQGWWDRKAIPAARRQPEVIAYAASQGVRLRRVDFFDDEPALPAANRTRAA